MYVREIAQDRFGGQVQVCVRCDGELFGEIG